MGYFCYIFALFLTRDDTGGWFLERTVARRREIMKAFLLVFLLSSSLATAAEDTSTSSATVEVITTPGNPWGVLADASGPAKPSLPSSTESAPAPPVVIELRQVDDDASGKLAAAYDRIEELKSALEARDQQVASLREELSEARLSDKETGETASQGREMLLDKIRRLQAQIDAAAKASGKDIEATGLERAATQKRIVELEIALLEAHEKVESLREELSEARLSDKETGETASQGREMLLDKIRELTAERVKTIRNLGQATGEVEELGLVLRARDSTILALQGDLEEANRALEIARNDAADSPAEPVAESTPAPEPTATTLRTPSTSEATTAAEDILRRLEEGDRKLKAAGH